MNVYNSYGGVIDPNQPNYPTENGVLQVPPSKRIPPSLRPGSFVQRGSFTYQINDAGVAVLIALNGVPVPIRDATLTQASINEYHEIVEKNKMDELRAENVRLTDLVAALETELATYRITG